MAKIMRRHILTFSATDFPEVVNFQFLLHLHFSFREMLNNREQRNKKMIAD